MKSIFKYILCTCVAVTATSCDFLDVVPDNIATEEHAFADRYTVEKYLATCYSKFPATMNRNANPAIFGALEMILNTEYNTEKGMQFGLGLDSSTSALINYWGTGGLYAGIRECNTFMKGIVNVEDLDEYEKQRMIAEVKLIKAYLHFYLLSYYGPICPLRESPPVTESTQGVRVYREKVDDCFQYVMDLINEVIDSESLPLVLTNPSSELGRFTQPAAHMLKAKVLLYWASPLFNGNTDYNSFLDHNGEPFFNQVYDPTRWTAAAEACKKAVEVSEAAGIRLYQTSDYVATKPLSDQTLLVQTLRGVISHRWNPEVIWSNTASIVDGGFQMECFTYFETSTSLNNVWQKMSVPLSTVERFYSKNGVPIEEDNTYDYASRYSLRVSDAEHRYYIQRGEQTAALNFDREPRFYSTLGFDRGKWYGNSYKNMPDDDAECLYPKNRFGEVSSVGNPGHYNATGYWPKKLVSINSSFRDANSITWESYPFPDMRYADLLLMCAEALNESKDAPGAEVYKYIDMVRERAGLKGVVESWSKYSKQPNKPTTKEGMRDIIRQERKIELTCEGSYYWDSHRWKTALAEQNRIIEGWNINASDVKNYYTPTVIYEQSFEFKNYFAPIPESEIVKNPLLRQNMGW